MARAQNHSLCESIFCAQVGIISQTAENCCWWWGAIYRLEGPLWDQSPSSEQLHSLLPPTTGLPVGVAFLGLYQTWLRHAGYTLYNSRGCYSHRLQCALELYIIAAQQNLKEVSEFACPSVRALLSP